MKPIHAVLAAVVALLLAACYPPTTTHIPGKIARDTRLVGLWTAKIEGESRPAYFHFLPQEDGTVTAVMVESGDKPGGDYSAYSITTSKAGANMLMNVRVLTSNGKPDNSEVTPAGRTIPLLYRFDAKGQLTLAIMNERATKDAIKAHKIAGTVGQGDTGDAVINADPATLEKFFASKEALALFDNKSLMVLTKKE